MENSMGKSQKLRVEPQDGIAVLLLRIYPEDFTLTQRFLPIHAYCCCLYNGITKD